LDEEGSYLKFQTLPEISRSGQTLSSCWLGALIFSEFMKCFRGSDHYLTEVSGNFGPECCSDDHRYFPYCEIKTVTTRAIKEVASFRETKTWITFQGFTILFIAAATAGNVFSIFQGPILSELGWSRGLISLGQSIQVVVSVVGLSFVGWVLDRFGIRQVILSGIIIMISSLAILSRTFYPSQFCFAMALLGLASALATVVPVQTLVVRWFHDASGKILGTVFLGQGFGGVVIPLVINPYVKSIGWRKSLFVLAASLPLLFLLVLFLPNPPKPAADRWRPDTWVHLLIEKRFWIFGLILLLAGLGTGGLIPHLILISRNNGFGDARAASALSVLNGASMFAALLAGWVSHVVRKNKVLGVAYCLGFIGIILLTYSRSVPFLFLSAALCGVGIGAAFPVWAPLIDEHYGSSNVARLLGLTGSIFLLGWVPSIMLFGFSFDLWKSYAPGLLFAAGCLIVASGLITTLRITNIPAVNNPRSGTQKGFTGG
jgi:MFS family permease